MSLEWAYGVLILGIWSILIDVSFALRLTKPVIRMTQIAYRKSGFSVARCFNVELNLPGILILVSIGKAGTQL